MSSLLESDVNAALNAPLLVTNKYARLWRRSLYIRIFISLARTTTTTATATPQSEQLPHYTPLPTSPSLPARTSSAKSFRTIDVVSSDNEEEEDVARIVKDKDFDSLRELGGVRRVRSVLSRRQSEECNIDDNGNHHVLENQVHGRSLSCCFVNSCKRNSYTISLLMISALLSLVIEIKQEGPKYGWHDCAAILVAIIMIISFSSVVNFWRERKVQNSAANSPEKIMPLESRIEKPISFTDKVALLISAIVMLAVLIRLLGKKNGDNSGSPEIKGKVSVGFLMELMERIFLKPQGKVSILTSLITVAIISMQHGVPLMVTISLKYQMDKLVSDQVADLHDLSSCATMGLVTVICIDASGGLISKLMEVGRIRIGEKDISTDMISEIHPNVLDILQRGARASILAPEFILSPVSNSLISWTETTWGVNRESFGENLTILQRSEQNYRGNGNGVLVKVGDHEDLHLHWSGTASKILEMCSHYYDSDGECHGITNQKVKLGEVIKEMEDNDLEPIALAYKTETQELQRDGLTLLALVGLKHSCLEKTKSALAALKNDGIKIKLVSEQDIVAVRALASELGIIEVPAEDGVILEGQGIRDLNRTAILKKLDEALVMGGFLPDDKVLMIRCLQDEGHVVAFFGGLTVRDAAVREAADIVIDAKSQNPRSEMEGSNISVKCFSAITTIVKAGRCQYHNIQKFIQLQLTATLSGSFITLITTMCTGESPLAAIQLIWVNTIMCLLGGLLILMKLDIKEDQHASQPNVRKQSLITQEIWKDIAIDVLYQASLSLIFLFGGQVTDSTKQVRKTMIFNTFMLCQVFNQLKVLGLVKKGVFKMVLLSYCFLVTLGVCVIMQVLVIQYANSLADCMRLNPTQWIVCVGVSALSWVIGWPLKKILTWILHRFHPCTI